MATFIIPIDTSASAFKEKVSLSGTFYVLTFRWNSRLACWFMDIAKADETPLLYSLAIRESMPTTFRYIGKIAWFPPGAFIPIDVTSKHKEATSYSLGVTVLILYQEPGG